ncbi:60S acidic ribosomal protein P2 [Colletotrichum fructicola]|nr:60S acidic ribosomal protein P2 [Colletotrichum fructicola]
MESARTPSFLRFSEPSAPKDLERREPERRPKSWESRKLNTTIKMKHLAAYLLLGLGGNTSPSAKDVKAVLESVGIEADDERLNKLISELEGKDINELISEGSSKLASVPSGGAGAAPAAGGAAAGGAAEAEAEAPKEEEKEESDDDMGFGLFD